MGPRKITIDSTTTVTDSKDSSSKPYTAYDIRIAHPFPRATTRVQKRYSDFCALNSALHSQTGAYPPSTLPPKSWLGGALGKLGIGGTSQNPAQVEERRRALEAYLQAIEQAGDTRWRESPAYLDFLGLSAREGKVASFPGSQFGKDRVRDAADWLDKYESVKSSLQEARQWLTKREQAVAAQAQHEAGANAKRELVRGGTLISALVEGLDRLSGKSTDEWGGDKLGEGEVRRRRDMISAKRKERDDLETVLNSMAVKAAAASTSPTSSTAALAQTREGLFKGASSGGRVLGAPAKETEKTRELDNDGVLQLQKQIIAEQDEDLVDLTKVVRRMREMGVQINEEVVLQNQMLGLLEEDVTRVDGKMKIAKKRIDKIR